MSYSEYRRERDEVHEYGDMKFSDDLEGLGVGDSSRMYFYRVPARIPDIETILNDESTEEYIDLEN
jgi:hypothetical protein